MSKEKSCCKEVGGFYLGTTCPTCKKPFRVITTPDSGLINNSWIKPPIQTDMSNKPTAESAKEFLQNKYPQMRGIVLKTLCMIGIHYDTTEIYDFTDKCKVTYFCKACKQELKPEE